MLYHPQVSTVSLSRTEFIHVDLTSPSTTTHNIPLTHHSQSRTSPVAATAEASVPLNPSTTESLHLSRDLLYLPRTFIFTVIHRHQLVICHVHYKVEPNQ